MQVNKFNFKAEWHFLKWDLFHYTLSTLYYIILCMLISLNIQTLIYALFDCILFYFSFWYIRVKFNSTYHSDDWNKCKKYTRALLLLGNTVLWLLPFKGSLFNSIFVAFMCAFVLYLISVEVTEKKKYKYKNKLNKQKIIKLNKQILYLLNKVNYKNIYAMSEQELYEHCRSKGLSEEDCRIAYFVVIERLKGKELYDAIGYSERQTKRKRKQILETIK